MASGTAPIQILRRLFASAVDSADPLRCLPPHLPPPPRGRTIVVGAGKAAASMAQAVERHWKGPVRGLVVTRYGHGLPCRSIEVIEAAHPVPDDAGESAAQIILGLIKGLTADDLVLCLISGGGSALLSLPAKGVTLAHKLEGGAEMMVSASGMRHRGRDLYFQGFDDPATKTRGHRGLRRARSRWPDVVHQTTTRHAHQPAGRSRWACDR